MISISYYVHWNLNLSFFLYSWALDVDLTKFDLFVHFLITLQLSLSLDNHCPFFASSGRSCIHSFVIRTGIIIWLPSTYNACQIFQRSPLSQTIALALSVWNSQTEESDVPRISYRQFEEKQAVENSNCQPLFMLLSIRHFLHVSIHYLFSLSIHYLFDALRYSNCSSVQLKTGSSVLYIDLPYSRFLTLYWSISNLLLSGRVCSRPPPRTTSAISPTRTLDVIWGRELSRHQANPSEWGADLMELRAEVSSHVRGEVCADIKIVLYEWISSRVSCWSNQTFCSFDLRFCREWGDSWSAPLSNCLEFLIRISHQSKCLKSNPMRSTVSYFQMWKSNVLVLLLHFTSSFSVLNSSVVRLRWSYISLFVNF